MIKNRTISEIIYRKLFYKNIKILILAAIFFFFITISLFILYQIRVANVFSKQVEVDLNNLVLNANITKNYIQKKYNSIDQFTKNDSKIINDLKIILITHDIIANAGFSTKDPLNYKSIFKSQGVYQKDQNILIKGPKSKIDDISVLKDINFWFEMLSKEENRNGLWEIPIFTINENDRPTLEFDYPIFNKDRSKMIANAWISYNNNKFFQKIYDPTHNSKMINKYYLAKDLVYVKSKNKNKELKTTLKSKFISISGNSQDEAFTKDLANKIATRLKYKKLRFKWFFSNGYLYFLENIPIKKTVSELRAETILRKEKISNSTKTKNISNSIKTIPLYSSILYQIDLKEVIAIILIIELIILIILALFGYLSIKNIKNHLTKLLRPLKVITKKTQEISNGNFDIQIKEKSDGYDINLLTDSINNMCQNLKSLTKKEKENIKTQAEIKLAQQIQESFVQKDKEHIKVQLDKNNLLEIRATFLAGNLISGDIYDITNDENKVNIFIGDTVGKDMAAAIFSLIVMSQYKAIQKNNSPKNIAKEINHFIFEQNRQSMFISAVFCSIDLEKLTLTISNAGHPNPIVINNKTKEAKIFDLKSNPVLGINKKSEYHQNKINLKENTEIIAYTDGVTESVDKDNKLYGEKRLVDTINKFKNKSNLLYYIKNDIKNFTNKEDKLDDDLTMIHIKIKSE